MKPEPKRHHYIPQFILRNFRDENSQVSYWNVADEKLEKRNTRSVFMNVDMYRDEINHGKDPTYIEASLAAFEKEIAELINTKILCGKEIIITREENEKLRIFLSLLSFRSDMRKEQYRKKLFDGSTRDILGKYSSNGFEDLWKREVEELSKCRSLRDIQSNSTIDPIIKMDFENDLHAMYMTFVDARGADFLLTDVYPTLEIFPVRPGVNVHMHCFYPLSSTRMLILNHIMFKEDVADPFLSKIKSFSRISGDMIAPPKSKRIASTIFLPQDTYIYQVRKIYQPDIEYVNALFLNEARIGIMFKDGRRIFDSVCAFNRREGTKRVFEKMEENLK